MAETFDRIWLTNKQPHKGGTDYVREETRVGATTHP
jgi:hypothetical protein